LPLLKKDFENSSQLSIGSSGGSTSYTPSCSLRSSAAIKQHTYSHPTSLQILHEDETNQMSKNLRAPPRPLAAFGSHKLTVTQSRRDRMKLLNKPMSEDIRDYKPRSGASTYLLGDRTNRGRSLQKLSESCEMRDLSGRSIYHHVVEPGNQEQQKKSCKRTTTSRQSSLNPSELSQEF
jgi:hypothetical protein